MHEQVKTYCESIKNKHPDSFKNKKVLDVGSLDINWNNRYLFENCEYLWIDLWEWPNVDEVRDITKWIVKEQFDTIISTEMLEHCNNRNKAFENMFKSLKSWWLLLLTAAWEWRWEHWTFTNEPNSAPFTNDFYDNVPYDWFVEMSKLWFREYFISKEWNDIRFYWIKK